MAWLFFFLVGIWLSNWTTIYAQGHYTLGTGHIVIADELFFTDH